MLHAVSSESHWHVTGTLLICRHGHWYCVLLSAQVRRSHRVVHVHSSSSDTTSDTWKRTRSRWRRLNTTCLTLFFRRVVGRVIQYEKSVQYCSESYFLTVRIPSSKIIPFPILLHYHGFSRIWMNSLHCYMLHVKISNENEIKRRPLCLQCIEMKKAVPCNTSFLKQTREHDSLVNWILPSKAQKSSLLLLFRKGLRRRSALRVFSRILL